MSYVESAVSTRSTGRHPLAIVAAISIFIAVPTLAVSAGGGAPLSLDQALQLAVERLHALEAAGVKQVAFLPPLGAFETFIKEVTDQVLAKY